MTQTLESKRVSQGRVSRVLVFGYSGSGKTVYVRWQIRTHPAEWIVVDPENEHDPQDYGDRAIVVATAGDAARIRARGRRRGTLPDAPVWIIRESEGEECAALALEWTRCVLVLDEGDRDVAGEVLLGRDIRTSALYRIYNRSRQPQVASYTLIRRPHDVARTGRANATHYAFAGASNGDELADIKRITSQETADMVAELRQDWPEGRKLVLYQPGHAPVLVRAPFK